MRPIRAAIAFCLLSFYIGWVFRLTDGTIWHLGLGDWMDPYFSNALMEHWYQSLLRMSDPSSPPMYHPVRGTLGYSHGLILYVPFYAAARPFLHPFAAQTVMLLLVMVTGMVCLFAVFRRHQRLSFLEAALLSAFFLTSRNVTNGETGVWLQRASVLLVPPALLLLLHVSRMRDGGAKLVLAGLSGLLATLLFTQDFQTALFTMLILLLAGAVLVLAMRPPAPSPAALWRADRSLLGRAILVTSALAVAWTVVVIATGGVALRIANITVRPHDWRRPALIAVGGILALIAWHWRDARRISMHAKAWHVALAVGALTGLAIFVWIYLPSYREHHAFAEQDLLDLLTTRNPATWRGPFDVLKDLAAYRSMRSFLLVMVLGLLVWTPALRFDKPTRVFALAVLLISALVMVLPIRFGDFSVWRTVFWPLPGVAAIRDPSRIIPVYELAVVLVVAAFLAHIRTRAGLSRAVAVLLLTLMVTNWNPERFDYIRTTAEFDRWIVAPVEIDRTCASFFMKRGPSEYLARQGNTRTLYGLDALFISLRYGIPTLNGYSAWSPDDWGLAFPEEPEYLPAARKWIARHGLTGTCEFDVQSRKMQPFAIGGSQ